MKKLMMCCLVILLVYTNMFNALADTQYITEDSDFSIRGGIHFGATKAEIDAIEQNNGNKHDDVDVYYGDTYDLAYLTLLAGYKSYVTYWMDEDGILNEFQYILPTKESYTTVKSALVDKYGAPMNTTSTSTALIAGTGIDRASKKLENLTPSDKDYAGWVIKYNDCFLMIEAKHIYLSYAGMSLYVVNYDVLSYDEMQLLQEAYDGLLEYMNTSFSNDL